MAQNFNSLKASSLIKNDRQTINDNFDAVRSCHSGTAYPTTELVAGMLFFNTSTKKLYEYNGSAWVQILDLSSGTAVAPKSGNADSATKATGDKNGKDITTYVAKLEQDTNNKFVIRVYNGANTLMTTITIPETDVDVMTGASSSSAGKAGLVPAPSAGAKNRYLNAYGNFETINVPVQSVNGKTGDVVVDLPVGHMYWSVEPNVPAGRLPAMGATYNRALYADLWAWANSVGLVKTESEWQAIASANDGNCAYYSSGDGSTTFRVPSIKCWVKGANSVDEVGRYLEAGLPNITGSVAQSYNSSTTASIGWHNYQNKGWGSGALYLSGTGKEAAQVDSYGTGGSIAFDASRSSSVYGNSDTVQPPSLVGQWLIVAFGVAHNIGEADVANVMQAVEQVQTGLGTLEQGVGTAIDYIVESYRNGNDWYEIYKSGKVRQGGYYTFKAVGWQAITLIKPMANSYYSAMATVAGSSTAGNLWKVGSSSKNTATTLYASCNVDFAIRWEVEGQGA
jgi:hypothetical protein